MLIGGMIRGHKCKLFQSLESFPLSSSHFPLLESHHVSGLSFLFNTLSCIKLIARSLRRLLLLLRQCTSRPFWCALDWLSQRSPCQPTCKGHPTLQLLNILLCLPLVRLRQARPRCRLEVKRCHRNKLQPPELMDLMHRHRVNGHGHMIRRGLTSIPRVLKHGVDGCRHKKGRRHHHIPQAQPLLVVRGQHTVLRSPGRIPQLHRPLADGYRTIIRRPPVPMPQVCQCTTL